MLHPPARFVLGFGFGLALAVCAAPLSAASPVYKWKDARGVTHYSDSPPPTGAYREIAAPADKPAAPQAATPKGPPPISADCAQARLNLQHLQGTAPVGLDADRDGKPDAVMGDDERAKQRAQAEAAVRARCPGGT